MFISSEKDKEKTTDVSTKKCQERYKTYDEETLYIKNYLQHS